MFYATKKLVRLQTNKMINKIIQRLFMHWICIYETNKSTVDWW